MSRSITMVKEKSAAFTPEDSAKGGKTTSYYKSLARVIGNRKHCSTTCLYFSQCPVAAMALNHTDTKTGVVHPCLMKEFPPTVKQQFIDLFLTGEEGIISGIKKALHNYMNDVDAYGNLRDKRDMVKLMMEFYQTVYCNPRKTSYRKEPLTITLRRVGMEPQTIEISPNKALPEGVRADDLLSPANDDITEGDPESLVNSPILTTVMRPAIRMPDGTLQRIVMEEIKIESNIETIMEDEDEQSD